MSEKGHAYKKLMKEHNLVFAGLPKNARIGIETIKKIEAVIKSREEEGVKPTKKVLARLELTDKWVVNEIFDFLNLKNK